MDEVKLILNFLYFQKFLKRANQHNFYFFAFSLFKIHLNI